MTVYPLKIELAGEDRLHIEWNDGSRREYTFVQLRDGCTCATCREKHKAPSLPEGALPVLSAAETQPIKVLGMKPVGNYAYSIAFSDGHDTGIFTFDHLLELGQDVTQ